MKEEQTRKDGGNQGRRFISNLNVSKKLDKLKYLK